jgi:predicted amidohydrolase
LIKIHKVYSPFRPLVNWTNAPVYKLAKMLSKKLEIYIPLPNLLNVKNTIQLMKDLLEIPFTKI